MRLLVKIEGARYKVDIGECSLQEIRFDDHEFCFGGEIMK
jgi:hypothetical protein